MLLRQHPRRQLLRIVIRHHGYSSLNHDRPLIQLWRDEMHRGAMQPHASRDGPGMGIQTGKGWQQGRMNIQQTTFIALYKRLAQDAHEACQQQQIGIERLDAAGQRSIEGLASGIGLMVHHRSRNTLTTGIGQPRRLRPIGDHGNDLRPGQASLDQRAHIAATTRDKYD